MFSRTHSRRSAGFTLIELLVVISIIAVLAALTMAAVQKVRDVGKRTQVTVEIRQMDLDFGAFQQKLAVREIACRGNGNLGPAAYPTNNIGGFMLRPNYGTPGSSSVPDYTQSFEYRYLKQAFPNAELGQDSSTFINGLPNTELDPSHLICFWLGGYYAIVNAGNISQTTPVFGQGFNADARYPFRFDNPAASYPNVPPPGKKGPFYDFPTSRLSLVSNTAANGGSCPRYLDPWGTPYCFFATENGRDNNYAVKQTPAPVQVVHFDWNGSRAVPLLTKLTPTQYANQKTFQIFSAGRPLDSNGGKFPYDLTVVAPQLWVPGGGSFTEKLPGGQNYSNFNPTFLAAQP